MTRSARDAIEKSGVHHQSFPTFSLKQRKEAVEGLSNDELIAFVWRARINNWQGPVPLWGRKSRIELFFVDQE